VITKVCSTCKIEKDISEFYYDQTYDRYYYVCKSCHSAYVKQYELDNPSAKMDRYRKKKYGISPFQFEVMLLCQGGRCQACGRQIEEDSDWSKALCVDHDHSTGKVRGLLCRPCNRGLGFLTEEIDVVIGLVEYLGGSVAR
jgi:Autographiviridae endonuclease VII